MKDGMVQDDKVQDGGSQDGGVYRCVAAQCGRLMPRRVHYCPWCGTAQGVAQPAPVPSPTLAKAPVEPVRAASGSAGSAASAASAAAAFGAGGVAGQSVPPAGGAPRPSPANAPVAASAPASPPASPAASQPSSAPGPSPAQPRPAGPATGPAPSGHAQPGRGIPPPPGVGRGGSAPAPARPPERPPVRLRWWIVSLAALWLIWLIVRPEGTRIERRMDRAVSLAVECKAREAQDELIALRSTRATPEKLRQVQASLNKAAADCTRAEQRAKAWEDASGAIQKLRRAHSYDKALARLATFTKRWGEDEETRALKERLRTERDRPLADPTRGE